MVLEDEIGWTPVVADLAFNYDILAAIVLLVPSFIPALGFLALALQLADKIVDGKLLSEFGRECDSWKYLAALEHRCFSTMGEGPV